MSNLLPQEEKKVLENEYKIKLIILFNLFLGILLFVLLSFLILFNFLLKDTQKLLIEANNKSVLLGQEEKIYEKNIKDLNEKLKILKIKTHFITPSQAIDLLLKNKNSGIKILTIDFSITEKEGFIDITGVSKEREDLVSFIKNLEKEDLIETVDSPISNLSKNNDIPFNIKITLKKNEDKK